MAIRRYKSEADTTITNAYKGNLATRATGSNMGESDVLEVFNLYAQADSTSSEQSRILIKFPTTGIASDRAAGVVPASGKVKFYLKLYNVPHGETLPTNFNLEVTPLEKAWDEGHGLDMEEYSDMGATGVGNTFGGTGASWTVASSGVNWTTAGGDLDTRSCVPNTVIFPFNGNSTDESCSGGVVTSAETGSPSHVNTAAPYSYSAVAGSTGYMTFPGTITDYLTISSSAVACAEDPLCWDGAFTIDFWINFPTIPVHPNGYSFIMGSGNAAYAGAACDGTFGIIYDHDASWFVNGEHEWNVLVQGPSGDATMRFGDASGSDSTCDVDTWYHIAVTSDSNRLFKVYQDGVLIPYKGGLVNPPDPTVGNPVLCADSTPEIFSNGAVYGTTDASIEFSKMPDNFPLGRHGNFSLDEFRITKGTAIDFATVGKPQASIVPAYSYIAPLLASFEDGDEDLEIDITSIVENWITIQSSNYGLVVKLADAVEAGTESFYTKRFSARSSEYFFNRPIIEARWDSSDAATDDRDNFYAKSNLRSLTDNQNTVSIKNYVDNVLKNIPDVNIPDVEAFATDVLYLVSASDDDAFTVTVPTAAGGLGTLTTVVFKPDPGSGSLPAPPANTIYISLSDNDAINRDLLVVVINGTLPDILNVSKARFGDGLLNTDGVKGLTASVGTGFYISLEAGTAGTAGNEIAVADSVGATIVQEGALSSGKLSGGVNGYLDMTAKFYADSTKVVDITPDSLSMDNSTTGVYKATVVLDTALSSVYVVWQNAALDEFHTETIQIKQRSAAITDIPVYVTTIQNLKKVYSNDESARFRLFIRSKDWSPTIYSVATKELKSEVVEDAYYRIMRVVDDFTVVDYGSGTIPHTKLSYDENGPYFDFDMSMLETGWAYQIELMYKIGGEMRQQPEAFKFRVVE